MPYTGNAISKWLALLNGSGQGNQSTGNDDGTFQNSSNEGFWNFGQVDPSFWQTNEQLTAANTPFSLSSAGGGQQPQGGTDLLSMLAQAQGQGDLNGGFSTVGSGVNGLPQQSGPGGFFELLAKLKNPFKWMQGGFDQTRGY